MKHTVVATLVAFLVALPGGSADAQSRPLHAFEEKRQESLRFHRWLDDQFSAYLDFHPLSRTRLGDRKDQDKLDDVSVEAMQALLEWRRASVEEMQRKFDRSILNDEGRLSWDLWVRLKDQAESAVPFRYHRYVFGRRGPHTSLPNHLMNYHRVDTVEDMKAYISRLKQVDRYLGQYLERAREAARRGIRAPGFDYDIAISQIHRVLQGAPFDDRGVSALYRDVERKIGSLQARGVVTDEAAVALGEQARQALLLHVMPAYRKVLAWLEADRIHVPTETRGVWSLPDGRNYYDYRLVQMTTLPLTADEIHDTGLREVSRIRAEMKQIMDRTGFEGSLQAFFRHTRDDDRFYFPNTDEGRAGYLALANHYLEEMRGRLPDYFGILPGAPLVIKRVEAYREQPGGAAHYMRGTKDGITPGVFYVHLSDMRAVSKYRLESLVYHEGLPGHHFQISIQQELDSVPRFRTYHGYTAFSEGWALYAERMAKNMGFYQDPWSDFGRLSGEIWRAIRLVVDTGIHAKGWTEDRAVKYAMENSPRPEAAVRSEIRRYFNNPAQATTYMIGMLEILALRTRAQATLGSRFDDREFHDVILGSGPLPLPLLREKVLRWTGSDMGREE